MVTKKSKKIQLSGDKKPQLKQDESIRMFYSDIRKYRQLSQEETKELFKSYHNGTKEESNLAFEKLCNHNMRLVISLAREYCSAVDNLNDLIQEGNMGLMKAIEMFDEENGASFTAYSMYWIRRYINIFRSNVTPIVAQTNRSKTANVIVNISDELWHKLERVPTPDEILDEYNRRYPNKTINDTDDLINVEYVFIDRIEQTNEANMGAKSSYVDYNAASASYNTYLKNVETDYNKEIISRLLNTLTPKEVKAIRMLYGLNDGLERSINSISSEMGVSNQRIVQLCSTALKKMKRKSKELSYSFK